MDLTGKTITITAEAPYEAHVDFDSGGIFAKAKGEVIMIDPDIHGRRRLNLHAAAGVSEILVFGNARVLGAGTQAFPTFFHLLGVDTGNGIALALIRREQAPLVLSPSYFLIDDLKAGPPTPTEWIWSPWPHLGERLSKIVAADGPIGLIGKAEMPVRMWEAILSRIDASRFVDLDGLAAQLRIIPDEAQAKDHRTAAAVVDALFAGLPSIARGGEPTWMLQRRLEADAMLRGADQCVCWMTTAPAADYYRSAKTVAMRIPQEGDQLLLGVMLTVSGAWGHGIRTYHLGPPGAALLALHRGVTDLQDQVFALLRPDRRLTEMNDVIETLYRDVFAEDLENARRFRTVHGLGFSYEEPASSPMFRQPFETPQAQPAPLERALAGMVFEIHPNLFLPGIGGAAVGDMLMIHKDTNERLTRFPRHLHVI